MRRDTIDVLLCGGDWIKEMYGIRSLKEKNDDPIELKFESVYEMIDPNASTSTAKVAMPANQPTTSSVPIQPVKTTNKPPKTSKKTPTQFKKSRKTFWGFDEERASLQRAKRMGERGSPCRSPQLGLNVFETCPLTITEYTIVVVVGVHDSQNVMYFDFVFCMRMKELSIPVPF
ncbi:hypothetical protein LIER_04953 [Lithospermum erythrorhizon]|uniref:Uncharacterized protein n=1 Tax=Lithospermum erythrorhizon TaxID=34254 RepID=A0AAV3NZ59_LITER